MVASPDNTIGGTTAAARDVISGNAVAGVFLVDQAAAGNVIEGDYLGTDANGSVAVPNKDGILLAQDSGTTPALIVGATIGGTVAGAGNVISGNTRAIRGYLTNGLIAGNLVGLDAAGRRAISNGSGIAIVANLTTIGGTTAAARNVISGNFTPAPPGIGSFPRSPGGAGVELSGDSDRIEGNFIGPDATGKAAVTIPLGTGNLVGIKITQAVNTTVGGTASGAGNVISGNASDGLQINAGNNLVQGNDVGTDSTGSAPLPNGGSGISTAGNPGGTAGAPASLRPNTIGGTVAGAGNTIAFNAVGISSSNNSSSPGSPLNIRGNSIFGNSRGGISTSSPNTFTTFLTSATASGSSIAVAGELVGKPGAAYLVDVFANPAADPSAYGQGQVLLGTVTATPDAGGFAAFGATFAAPPFGSPALSTTVTDPSGNPSGFTQDFPTPAGVATGNLTLAASASPTGVIVNNDVAFTFTVTNNGKTTAESPSFTASLPAGLINTVAFTSAATGTTHQPGDFEGVAKVNADGTVSANLDNLAPGQSAVVTVVATATRAGSFGVDAGVFDTIRDANYADNEATASFAVLPPGPGTGTADLAIAGATRPGPVFVYGPANFPLTVTNNGPGDATNVIIRDVLAGTRNLFGPSITLSGVTPSQGSVASATGDGNSGYLFVINLGTIAAGKSATIAIDATANQQGGPVTNIAKVVGDQYDPTAADKTAEQSVNVAATPYNPDRLAITGATAPPAPTAGGNLTYSLTVAYTGAGQASYLHVGDALPAGTKLVSAASSQGVAGALDAATNTVFFALNPVAPGTPVNLTVVVATTKAGVLSSTASLSGNDLTRPFTTVTQNVTVRPAVVGPTPALAQPPADFDGSGRTNLAVYLPAIGALAYRPTAGGPDVFVPFGIPGPGQTIPAPGDYTGAGHAEIAAYLPAYGQYAYRPAGGGRDVTVPFGIPGPGQSLPAPADYEGSGRDDIAVYMPAIAAFGIRPAAGGPDRIVPFGIPGPGQSLPAPADYLGTGRADVAAYLAPLGAFAIRPPGGGPDVFVPFGVPGVGRSVPVPGDYDGSGRAELAVYMPALGLFAYRPARGGADVIVALGPAGGGSVPVPGDYGGSGHLEPAVYDPHSGTLAYRPARGGPDVVVAFGSAGPGRSLPAAAPASVLIFASNSNVSAAGVPVTTSPAMPAGPARAARRSGRSPVAQADTARPGPPA